MDDLIKALKVIQEECNKHTCGALSNCKECPMGTNEGCCKLSERTPDNWMIIEPKVVVRIME